MKRILLALGLFSAVTVNAQVLSCGTDGVMKQLRQQNPSILQNEADLEAFTQWFIANHNNLSRDSSSVDTNYVVPVVFHVLQDGGILKSGDNNAQLDDKHLAQYEIQNMNEYWNATAPDLGMNSSIPYWRINPDFRAIVANMNIQFALARKDPDGNATNGIDRIYTYATHVGGNEAKRNPWPREKYLNIWVSQGLDGDTNTYGVLAYSMYPSAVANQTQDYQIDGIDSKASCVGVNPADAHNNPNSYCNFSRPCIAHEAGHWLNLKHPWGDTNDPGVSCGGSDEVDDTPITQGCQNCGGCDSTVSDNTCDTVPNGSPNTNVQNCMNYSNHHVMFTKGQRDRSRAAIESPVSGRNNIWSADNLAATGVEPLYDVLPTPIAQFGYNQRYACIGQTIRFTDYTYNTSEWERQWTFPDDATVTNVSGSDSMLNVVFTSAGWKTITLTTTNASGSSVKTKTPIYIYDNSQASFPYPFFESFDDSVLAAQWVGVSYDSDSDGNYTKFSWDGVDGHNSNGSYKLNGYRSTYRGDRDMLISPAFDFTGVPTSDFRFTFDYSMACRFDYEFQGGGDSIAYLEVYITSGCTGNWVKVPAATIVGNRKLFNGGYLNAPYTPGHDNQYWKTVTVDLSAMANSAQYRTSGVHIMFAITGARVANNFYFDNFNLGNAEAGISTIANI
ncbi:MAG TPA: M43 family zinc metalloprotease, partial [Chitinophagales bacterium]